MNGSHGVKRVVLAAVLAGVCIPQVAAAQNATAKPAKKPAAAEAQPQEPPAKQPSQKNYDEVYERYLASARSLSMPAGLWMADLTSDPNARRVNDLVTIRVVESLSATGSADATVNKKGAANVTIPLPKTWLDATLNNIVPYASATAFNGSGGTTRTTELTATMTARVMEVLPNGDMVVQGVREVDINGDRNLVVLTGVIRAMDVMPGNVIPSSRIAQMRISSLSQGLIKDSLSPGYLIRLLNKVF